MENFAKHTGRWSHPSALPHNWHACPASQFKQLSSCKSWCSMPIGVFHGKYAVQSSAPMATPVSPTKLPI